jgi:hypothetical protein
MIFRYPGQRRHRLKMMPLRSRKPDKGCNDESEDGSPPSNGGHADGNANRKLETSLTAHTTRQKSMASRAEDLRRASFIVSQQPAQRFVTDNVVK